MKNNDYLQKAKLSMISAPNSTLLHIVISAAAGFFTGLIIQTVTDANNAPLLCTFGSIFFSLFRRRLSSKQ